MMRAHSLLNFIFLVIREKDEFIFFEFIFYSKTFKPAKGTLSSSQLFVTSLHYIPLVEVKDFNALIDNKPFFNQPVKNK